VLDFKDDVALSVMVLDFEAIIKYNQNNCTHISLKVHKFTLKYNDQGQKWFYFPGKGKGTWLSSIIGYYLKNCFVKVEQLPT